MKIETEGTYKVVVFLPPDRLEEMMEAVNEAAGSIFPGYDRTFSYFPVTGTWRSLEGSNPFSGAIGMVSQDQEIRLEFAVFGKDLLAAVKAVRAVHPYEKPAIDIFAFKSGLSLLQDD
jgi:hypothetical protein